MRHEVSGRLVEVSRDGFHREHAVRQQREILLRQAEPAAEHAAQPVVQRLCETDAVARLGHLRAARQRMTRAIDVFGNEMRIGDRRFAFKIGTNRRDVRTGLARVDLSQYFVGTRLFRRRGFRQSRSVCFELQTLRFRDRGRKRLGLRVPGWFVRLFGRQGCCPDIRERGRGCVGCRCADARRLRRLFLGPGHGRNPGCCSGRLSSGG